MNTSFKLPNVDVKYSNIIINHKNRTATIDVQTRKHGNKRWSKVTTIEAVVTKALLDWAMLKFKSYDGSETTAFKLYLKKRGIEFYPGILRTLTFESYNLSEDYQENPFKLVYYNNGKHTLTLVNVRPLIKDSKGNYHKPVYQNKEGEIKMSYYSKNSFRRLVIQS
jgi:hypothetical protein